jgi:hypothetical protein
MLLKGLDISGSSSGDDRGRYRRRIRRHGIGQGHGHPHRHVRIDWMELLVQVIVAALGVALVVGLTGRRRRGWLRS